MAGAADRICPYKGAGEYPLIDPRFAQDVPNMDKNTCSLKSQMLRQKSRRSLALLPFMSSWLQGQPWS